MKNILKYFLGLSLILIVLSCKQGQNKADHESYSLTGKIEGLKDGTVIQLIPRATHSSELAIAKTKSKNGTFKFTGKLEGPRFFHILFGENEGMIPVMLENSKMTLTAEIVYSEQEGSSILFKDEALEGSKSHDLYLKETAFKKELNKDYKAYHKGFENISKLYGQARASGNKEKMDSIANTEAWKTYEAKEKAFFDKVEATSKRLILSYKDSWWGPFFMMTQYVYLTPEQRPLFDQFSEEAKNSYYGKLANEEINPKTLIGTNISNFNLKDEGGNSFEMKNVLSGKRYLLIDFWASWCAPCRKEIPNLKKAYEMFSGSGFEILSISIDKDKKAWVKALDQEDMAWPNLLDDGKVSNVFKVKAIPATFLINEKGVIIGVNLRGDDLEEKLSALFKS